MILVLIPLFTLFLPGCSSEEKKRETTVNTQLNSSKVVDPDVSVGLRGEDQIVYQKKYNLVGELVKLQDEVYILQEKVYGNPDYDSKGLYGKALECRSAKALVTGELSFVPDKTPVIEEDQIKVVQDQNKDLIGFHEEDLQKRLSRFKEYKSVLYSRQSQIENYIEKCLLDLRKN